MWWRLLNELITTDSRPLAHPPENVNVQSIVATAGPPAAGAYVQGVAPALPLASLPQLPAGAILGGVNVNQLPAFQPFPTSAMLANPSNIFIMSDQGLPLQALIGQLPPYMPGVPSIDPNAAAVLLTAPSLQHSQLMTTSALHSHLLAQQIPVQPQQVQSQVGLLAAPTAAGAGFAAHATESYAISQSLPARVNLDDSSSSLPTQGSGERDNRRSSSSITQTPLHTLPLSASTRSTTPSVASQQVLLGGLPLPVPSTSGPPAAADAAKTVAQMQPQQFVSLAQPVALAHTQQRFTAPTVSLPAHLQPAYGVGGLPLPTPAQTHYAQLHPMMGHPNLASAPLLQTMPGAPAYGLSMANAQVGALPRLPPMSFQHPLPFTQPNVGPLFSMPPMGLHQLQSTVPAQLTAQTGAPWQCITWRLTLVLLLYLFPRTSRLSSRRFLPNVLAVYTIQYSPLYAAAFFLPTRVLRLHRVSHLITFTPPHSIIGLSLLKLEYEAYDYA